MLPSESRLLSHTTNAKQRPADNRVPAQKRRQWTFVSTETIII